MGELTDYDLIWYIAGDNRLEYAGQTFAASAPSLAFLQPGKPGRVEWDRNRISRNLYLHFTPSPARCAWIRARTWPVLTPLPEGDLLRPLLQHVAWLRESEPKGWEHLAEVAIEHLLEILAVRQFLTVSSQAAQLSAVCEQMVRYLSRYWRNGRWLQPALAALAQAAGVTPAHLCRCSKRELGETPMRILLLMRIERAARLMMVQGLTIAAAAERCGFITASHFCRTFAAAYGMPPGRFQERIRAGAAWPALGGQGVSALWRRLSEELAVEERPRR